MQCKIRHVVKRAEKNNGNNVTQVEIWVPTFGKLTKENYNILLKALRLLKGIFGKCIIFMHAVIKNAFGIVLGLSCFISTARQTF